MIIVAGIKERVASRELGMGPIEGRYRPDLDQKQKHFVVNESQLLRASHMRGDNTSSPL